MGKGGFATVLSSFFKCSLDNEVFIRQKGEGGVKKLSKEQFFNEELSAFLLYMFYVLFLCTEREKQPKRVFLYFSLSRQREVSKRELVARFESEQITILKNCAAGLASLRQVLALPSSPFFNHRICVPDSFAIATIVNYQFPLIKGL